MRHQFRVSLSGNLLKSPRILLSRGTCRPGHTVLHPPFPFTTPFYVCAEADWVHILRMFFGSISQISDNTRKNVFIWINAIEQSVRGQGLYLSWALHTPQYHLTQGWAHTRRSVAICWVVAWTRSVGWQQHLCDFLRPEICARCVPGALDPPRGAMAMWVALLVPSQ